MWSTGSFSNLTGVPSRTLQYWSKERSKNNSGAGILSSHVNEQNGYRNYDKDSLIDVLIIKLAQDAGYSQDELYAILSEPRVNVFEASKSYIERLEMQKAYIDLKIEFAKTITLIYGANTVEEFVNQDCDNSIPKELLGLLIGEFVDSFAEVVDPDNLIKIQSTNDLLPAQESALHALARLFAQDEAMITEEVKELFVNWCKELSQVIPGYDLAQHFMVLQHWLASGYTPIVLELWQGEGFVEFLKGMIDQAIIAFGLQAE